MTYTGIDSRRSRMAKWSLAATMWALLLVVGPRVAAADEASRDQAAKRSAARAFCEDTLHGELWQRTELYFGTSRADEPPVTDDEFQSFLADEVTPRFPDGLTLVEANGQYRGSSGVIQHERTKLLILFYPWSGASNRKADAIREAYKTAYHQESVLRVDSTSCISF